MMDPHLIVQYQELMSRGAFRGLTTLLFADRIDELIKIHGAKTLLDYGCGQGVQYGQEMALEDKWGVSVTKYDPAVPEYSEKPDGRFDGVICVDVLEHIPEEQVDNVIKEIFSYANKFAFFTVCPRPAKKTLPDGRNCHLTVKPLIWWDALIEDLAPPGVVYEVRQND